MSNPQTDTEKTRVRTTFTRNDLCHVSSPGEKERSYCSDVPTPCRSGLASDPNRGNASVFLGRFRRG